MFNQEKSEVAAAQRVMLEILCEIHRICEENDIPYWLTEGTLLGAVRHKGFIPWDDDCDVGMMRSDFLRFLEIARSNLPKNMHLQTNETEEDYHLPFAKIRKDGTVIIETGETGKEKYHHGIFVDIFPYDRYENAWFAKWMNWGNTYRDMRKRYPKGSFKRLLATIYANIVMLIPIEISKFIRRRYLYKPDKYGNISSKYLALGLECGDSYPTLIENYFPLKLQKGCFENKDFYIPVNATAVLSDRYGKDYMTLPPVNERKVHSKYIRV